jgi:hypothetical protein
MGDGACGANVLAAAAKHYATVGDYLGLFFAVFLGGLEGLHVAECDAFAACCAFLVVDFWVPGDLVPRDAFVGVVLGHVFPFSTPKYKFM